ncbi:MAG: hypothetical protein R3B57_00675 [Phycisphaerales bacterium]
MTYVIVWRFRPDAGSIDAFVRAYDADGDWARFFATGSGHVGTELVDLGDGSFLTIDRWRTREDHARFLSANAKAYEALDQRFAHLCAHEERLGEGETR